MELGHSEGRALVEAIRASFSGEKADGRTLGNVTKVDADGTVWARLAGSSTETPCTRTSASVKPGDVVPVTVSRGRATIDGNFSRPATDDSLAGEALSVGSSAQQVADQSRALAESAIADAEVARSSASTAQAAASAASTAASQAVTDAAAASSAAATADGKAEAAASAASSAQTQAAAAASSAASASSNASAALQSATQANAYANSALTQLSEVENVVGVVNWITEHGTYVLTQDSAIVSGKVYYTRSGSGTSADPYVYTAVENPDASALSTYYELDIDTALSQYVATHLSLTNDGLYVIKDANGYKLLLANTGMVLYDTSGTSIASYGDTSRIGKAANAHLNMTPYRLEIIDDDGDIVFAAGRMLELDGTVHIEESFTGNGVKRYFQLLKNVSNGLILDTFTVSVDGDELDIDTDYRVVTGPTMNYAELELFSTPSDGAAIEISYTSRQAPNALFLGDGSKSFGESSAAFGFSEAYGDYSHAEGYKSITKGYGSHAEGGYLESYSDSSNGCVASGDFSHAEGISTESSALATHAEGINTRSIRNASHAEGWSTVANGGGAHAEGGLTKVTSVYAHAEGFRTIAKGDYSHAEGSYTEAINTASHSEGYQTRAGGPYSHAQNSYTVAASENQSVIGTFNDPDLANETFVCDGNTSVFTLSQTANCIISVKLNGSEETYNWFGSNKNKISLNYLGPPAAGSVIEVEYGLGTYAVIVGNGSSENDRSNAHALDWDGNAWYAGEVSATDSNHVVHNLTEKADASGVVTGVKGNAESTYRTGDVNVTPANVGAIAAESANGYWGMALPSGATNGYLRTPSPGIIPYQSGGSGSLGTAGWPFSNAYIKAIVAKSTNIDRDGSNPSSAITGDGNIYFRDKDNELIGLARIVRQTDGRSTLQLAALNEKTDGTEVGNYLQIHEARDGTHTYAVSSPANFRSAIGCGNLAGTTRKNIWSSGTTGTVTLSESAANYNHMRIYYYRSSNTRCKSVDVYSPNGKNVLLDMVYRADSTYGQAVFEEATISGTSITRASKGYRNIGTNNSCSGANDTAYLTIFRVEVWNE